MADDLTMNEKNLKEAQKHLQGLFFNANSEKVYVTGKFQPGDGNVLWALELLVTDAIDGKGFYLNSGFGDDSKIGVSFKDSKGSNYSLTLHEAEEIIEHISFLRPIVKLKAKM